jgi:hypothetical protein
VKFEIASQLPWSKEAKVQQLFWMYSQQLIDKAELLQELERAPSQSVYEVDQEHRLCARNENVWLLEGEFTQPFETDNHDIHLQEHEQVMNDPSKRRIYASQDGEQILAALRQHMKLHKEMMPPPPEPETVKHLNIRGEIPVQAAMQLAGTAQSQEEPAQDDQVAEPGTSTPAGGFDGAMYGSGGQSL